LARAGRDERCAPPAFKIFTRSGRRQVFRDWKHNTFNPSLRGIARGSEPQAENECFTTPNPVQQNDEYLKWTEKLPDSQSSRIFECIPGRAPRVNPLSRIPDLLNFLVPSCGNPGSAAVPISDFSSFFPCHFRTQAPSPGIPFARDSRPTEGPDAMSGHVAWRYPSIS
jgi:hypothetical protein